MTQIGTCCNCNKSISNDELHHKYFLLPTKTYACFDCDKYVDELILFFCIFDCLGGKKSWKTFRILKEDNDKS